MRVETDSDFDDDVDSDEEAIRTAEEDEEDTVADKNT